MGADGHLSTQQALLNLERSSSHPSELLDEAARILGTDYTEIRDQLFLGAEDRPAREPVVFAAKEEWVLRWLFKRTKPGAKTESSSSAFGASGNDDPRKWLLFYHLVRKVPVKKIAKTLREQDVLHQIQDALIHLAKAQKSTTNSTTVLTGIQTTVTFDSQDDGYGLPQGESNKRKRSPGMIKQPSAKDSATVQVIFSILRGLRICFVEAFDPNGKDFVSQQHMRIALSLAPGTASTIQGHVFCIVNSVSGNVTETLCNDLLCLLHDALRLWDVRQGTDLGHTVDECNKSFTLHCLLPALLLLRSIRQLELRDQHKKLNAWLERHVAQHAVEPARKVFFDELAVTWKPDQDPILSDHLKPTVDRLQTLLFPSSDIESQAIDVDGALSSFGFVAPILLEIAARSCRRTTIKKSQHERPWLEAVLVCVAHVGGCPLIDEGKVAPVLAEPRNNEQQSDADFSCPGPTGLTCLDGLFGAAIQWKVSISLPLLSSLVHHFAGLQRHQPTQWDVIAKVMKMDINVFLPNSGISNAKDLLDHFIEAVSSQSSSPDHHNTLQSHRHLVVDLVSRLMAGFASARDLGTFVGIWMNRLAAVEDARVSKPKTDELVDPYCIWEDEDVMTGFSRATKGFTTPDFIESHRLATTQALRDQACTGKHYALVTVLDLLVVAHKEEIGSAEDIVEPLYEGIQNVVKSLKTSGKLQGMLWRLLRHICPLIRKNSPLLLFEDVIGNEEQGIIEQAMQREGKRSVSYPTSAVNFNQVERFHCLIVLASLYPSALAGHVEHEVSSLTRHLVRVLDGDKVGRYTGTQLWDGRATGLESRFDLLTALLGILLQNSQVLCSHIDTTISLLKAVGPHVLGEAEGDPEGQGGLVDLCRALLLDDALVSTPGFVKKVIEATRLMSESGFRHVKMEILQALPKEAMSKAQRKYVLDYQRERATAWKEQNEKTRGGERLEVEGNSARSPPTKVDAADSIKKSEMTSGELQQSCRAALEAARSKTREDIIDLCQSFREGFPSRAYFLRLGSMLMKGDMASPHLTSVVADLSNLLPKSRSLENFCLTAACIRLMLDKHHESVNQWTVDNLLAQIAITLSPQGPNIPEAAPTIFERLCRLLGTLLGRYRIRLGGRYHLLLPALYGLLRYLFSTPHPGTLTTRSQVLFYSKSPPWIRLSTARLPKESATHLTRLLTSICDPTPSAVKRSRNPLTDETKAARKMAGQYMQYFIAEYASCRLNGTIDVEAKAALMPGLYTVMDAMGTEMMRALNAKMNASQRAIFKDLYEDYNRFGKWNGM